MAIYQQSNIKLQDALSLNIEQSRRIWFLLGLHVDVEDIPANATGIRTLVIKTSNDTIGIAVTWFAKKKFDIDFVDIDKFFLHYDEGPKQYLKIVTKVSKIEELQKTFPQLFELDGYLDAL